MLFGGHETTTNLIGNGAEVLVEHPAQLAGLREDLDVRMPAVIEELLRFEPPILRMGRVAKQALELRASQIAAGDRVYLVMAAANRDPEQFERPDELDLTRADNHQLTLGHGRHGRHYCLGAASGLPRGCLGAALGRLEGQMALAQLFSRFPRLRAISSSSLAWLDNLTVRGLEHFSVEIGA